MRKCSNLIFVIWVLLGSTPLIAQQGVHWTHELTNLPEDFDLEITQVDAYDRIWVGNQKGLWIFDGVECIQVKEFDISSQLSALCVLSLDSIAIGTNDGNAYLFSPGGIDTFACNFESPVSDILLMPDASAWISSSYNGLQYWRDHDFYAYTEENGLPSNNISDMEGDKQNGVWLATDNGLSHIQLMPNNKKNIHNYGAEFGLTDPLLTSLSIDEDKDLVYLSTHSAGIFSFQNDSFQQLISGGEVKYVHHIRRVDKHKLLVQADSPIISIYDLQNGKWTNIGIDESILLPALYTKEGFLWYFTAERRLQQESIYFTKFQTPQTPQAIIARGQQIWIGAQDGLYKGRISSRSSNWEKVSLLNGENIISLDMKGEKVLIGTFGNGLYLYDPVNEKIDRFTKANGLPDESILDIFTEGDQVWLGTLGGLAMTKWKNDQIIEVINYVDTVYVYHIDKVGERIYFSTHGDGAGHINGHIQWFQDSLLSSGEISTFGLLNETKALFVTAKNGLIYHQSGTNLKIQTPTSVSFETTSTIVADSLSQRFFISHTNGLDIFDPKDTTVTHLGNNLQLNFSTSALNAHSYDRSQMKHFFGSAGGFFCIEPDLYYSGTHPNLSILSCRINNDSRATDYLTGLGSNERTIQLDLLPIWYTDPRAVNIRYKIEGIHDQWIRTSDPKLIFTDLPYGNFQLNIEAGTYGQFYDTSRISLPINIAYPIWLRWWFIITAVSMILIGIYIYIKNRESKLQKWAKLEQEKANAQIQALKSQVSPHFMFNSFNTLIALIEEAPAKAVTYAENLSDFFRNLVSKRDLELNTLEEEVEMIRAYIALLKTRFNDSLNAHIEINNWEGYIITYTLQILTENVVKHNIISRAQPLEFSIKREDGFIVIENKKQPKYTREESTGFGLESIRERYKLLYQKDILIQESEDKFIVKVPIIENRQS